MADASFIQTSFLGGQWGAFAQGRIDRPDYRTAMNVCFNGFPIEAGGWVRRPGTLHAGRTSGGFEAKVFPFVIEHEAPYTMELTNGLLRLRSGTRLVTNDIENVVFVSAANPAVVKTVANHGWVVGNHVEFDNLGTLAPKLQNRQFLITSLPSLNEFTIADALTGVAIDGSTLDWSTLVPTGTVSRIAEFTTPYQFNDWKNIRIVQTDKTCVLLHHSYAPRGLTMLTPPTASADATFAFGLLTFTDGPYLDPDQNGITVTPGAKTGTFLLTWSSSGFTPIGGLDVTDVGRLVRLFSEPQLWDPNASYVIGDLVSLNGVYWRALAAGTSGGVYSSYWPGADLTKWALAPGAAVWSWGRIVSIVDALNANIALLGPDLLYTSPVRTWRLGTYSDTTGWPACGTYHEGRLWLSGSVANRIDGSVSNAPFSYSPTDFSGNVAASHGISYIFNAPDLAIIVWMQPDLQGIICGTQSGEWLVKATEANEILTPTSIQAHRVTKVGCANIEARRTEHTVVFVHRYQRKVQEYFADVYSGKMSSPNLSKDARNLTIPNVTDLAYQQELVPILWGICADGSWIGCTYKRETLTTAQGPTFAAWHLQALGSGRYLEQICTGPSVGGTLDALTMVTNHLNTGVRHVEMLGDAVNEGAALSAANYVDDGVVPSSTTQAAATADMPYGGLKLNGLWPHNGLTVTAWLGGLDCGDYVVDEGSITVPYGDGISGGTATGLFTESFVASFAGAMPMLVGFTFTSRGQIVRPALPAESGARNGPAFGKKRRNHKFAALLEGTQGVSFGTTFDDLRPALFRSPNGTNYSLNQQFSGIYKTTIEDDYSYDGMLAWEITRPYPCNVIAIGGFLQTQDE